MPFKRGLGRRPYDNAMSDLVGASSPAVRRQIAEVVFVGEGVAFVGEGVEADAARVLETELGVGVELGVAEGAVAEGERVQVRAGPAHRFVHDEVELGEGDRGGDEEPPPDGRLDFEEAHVELEAESFGLRFRVAIGGSRARDRGWALRARTRKT
jgi:hypothetical protein